MVEVARPRRTCAQERYPITNRPARRQHRGSKNTNLRAQTVATSLKAKTTLGIDFGSGHWSVAASFGGADPKSVPLGEDFNGKGERGPAYALPTNTRFGGAERFKFLGLEEIFDSTNVSSGLKQSFDPTLCKDGSEGQKFTKLCKENNVTPQEVLKAQLKVVLEFITAELRKQRASPIDGCRVHFTVPVIWTQDDRGTAIQNLISSCAIEVGFPGDIAFDVENFMADTYFRSQKPSHSTTRGKSRQGRHIQVEDLYIDAGAATIDFTRRAPIADGGAVILTGDPEGCPGGMSFFWPWLFDQCVQKGINFLTAKHHVFRLCDDSEDIRQGENTISVSEIKDRIYQCFAEAINMAKGILRKISHVGRILISGGAPSSNRCIQALWTKALHLDDNQTSKSRGNSALDVRFLPPDKATAAVALAAAIPYSDDPLPRFTARCFGFLCKDSKGDRFIQQVKPPRSPIVSSEWETVQVDEKNQSEFDIEPCIIPNGKGERLPRKSWDTFHPAWRAGSEVPMDRVQFDLSGHVLPKGKVKVRFMRREDLKFTLEVDCGNGKVEKKFLELRGDRERIYFVDRSHQEGSVDSSAAIDSQRSSQSPGRQIESQLEGTQGLAAQPPTPEQATQAAGEQPPGRLSASGDQEEVPAESADQEQTTESDVSAARDEASAEQDPKRNTPPVRLWGHDVYDIPATPPRPLPRSSSSKRKRGASQSLTPGSAVTTPRTRRRISLDDTSASGVDNGRGKNPGSMRKRSKFLEQVLEPLSKSGPVDTME